jgi:glutamate synthase domain-containing protein 2
MIWLLLILVVVVSMVVYDLTQTKHAILKNFPFIGHFRYWLEGIGPELRQYIVTNNDEERPFSRDQRSWVYASAKKQNNYRGFGTDNDLEGQNNYLTIKHTAFPLDTPYEGDDGFDSLWRLPNAKVIGGSRNRRHAFRPESIVHVSAMSFGSLSGRAVEAINRGCKIAHALHNTGEGGISEHHLKGGDLIWQIGTGYFGCRALDGSFDMALLQDRVASAPVRALEVKLSQGAKPGLGGVLPRAKITAEIAAIRNISRDRDCISPARHRAFGTVDQMLDFIEMLADSTGLPVGIKSAVGDLAFWEDLCRLMAKGDRGVDYIQIDGGEGGTGAAPLSFSDHVALPFKTGFARVYKVFARAGVADRIVWFGSGRLGFPEQALLAFALGCDGIVVAREAMLAIGCIQAQRCHTDHCPTGVATQNPWLVRGLDPTDKSHRLANYLVTLRKEVLRLCHATGKEHPALITCDDMEILDDRFGSKSVRELFEYEESWGRPDDAVRARVAEALAERRA